MTTSKKIKDRIMILQGKHLALKLKLKQGKLGPVLVSRLKKEKLSIKDQIEELERELTAMSQKATAEDNDQTPKPLVDQPTPPKKDGSHSDDWGVGKDLGNGNFEIEETKKTKNAA